MLAPILNKSVCQPSRGSRLPLVRGGKTAPRPTPRVRGREQVPGKRDLPGAYQEKATPALPAARSPLVALRPIFTTALGLSRMLAPIASAP